MPIKRLFRSAFSWTLIALTLNLGWEIAHVGLYTISEEPLERIANAVLHCAAGDGLIALAIYLLASALLRDASWPFKKSYVGSAIAAIAAVAFTAFSEWRNVYQLGAWTYLPSMPLVFGIGLSPLLQWIVIPLFTTALARTQKRSS